jgi:hypothetical protein
MAAGDIGARGIIRTIGSEWREVTSVEADTTARTFALYSTLKVITSANLMCSTDDDTQYRVVLNSNDGTAGTANGSLWVQSSGDDTYTASVTFI